MSNKTGELVQHWRDWVTHFNGTMVSFNDEGVVRPLRIDQLRRVDGRDFSNSRKDLALSDVTFYGEVALDNGSHIGREVAATECSLGFPELGFFDGNYTAAYSGYLARRQFRKALSDSMYYIDVPYYDQVGPLAEMLYKKSMRMPNRLSTGYCLQLFNNRYRPMQNSYERLRDTQVLGRALSKKFGLFVTDRSEHPVIVYRATPIGFVDENGAKIHTTYSELINEFSEKVSHEVDLYE